MDDKNILTYEQLIANTIERSLTYVECPNDDADTINVYLVTRNQHVLDNFKIFDFPFKHIDISTKQIHAVDVLSGKAVVINLTNTENVMIPGDPDLISPAVAGNPIFYKYITEKDIADIQLPFCVTIQKLKDAGCYTSNTVDKNILQRLMYFCGIFQTLNFDIPVEIRFLLSDRVHMMCTNTLHNYINEEKYELLTARYILNSAKEEIKNISLNTFEEIKDFLSEPEKVIAFWKSYIQRLIEEQITNFNNEYEVIVSELVDESNLREKEFIRLQYDKAISDLKNIDIDENLRKFGTSTLLMLRYLPEEIKKPEDLQHIRMFTAYENAICKALIRNGVNVTQNELEFDYLDVISKSHYADDILIQLNALYLDEIKEIRLQQIIRHADELVKTVEMEAEELDEQDLAEIISSIREYDTYKLRLDEYTDISSVLQYWPSILLPAPLYAARLDNKLQSPLLNQLQS